VAALMAIACGSGPKAGARPVAGQSAPAQASPSAHSRLKDVFLWSLPLTATEAVLALTAQGESEGDIGRSLQVSFQLPGEPAEESRRRFPQLVPGEGSRTTIAPFLEQPQRVDASRTEATFVIDYDELSVQELLATVPADQRTPEGLEAFVARTLESSFGRGFDIASRVATLKHGDCTEHAVLLAALLRASGYSARVIVGVAVILSPDFAMAAGHAWVEAAEDGIWHRRDAAIYRDHAGNWPDEAGVDSKLLQKSVRLYLATNVLESEGPNFAVDLISYAHKFAPQDLRLERIEAP
jgi:hypothetical protein